MSYSSNFRHCALVSLLILVSFGLTPLARAESYLGLELGLGVPSGTGVDQSSGLVLGATAGYRLTPSLGLALTYQYDGLKQTLSGQSFHESLFLAEANFFTLFFLESGAHVGWITTHAPGYGSSTDLGLGMHTGLDIKVTNDISIGGAVYWTYVTTTNDKHSLFNFMVPIKYWF